MKTGYKCPKCKTDMVRTDEYDQDGQPLGHHCPGCGVISDRMTKKNFGVLFKEHEEICFKRLEKDERNNGNI